mmetsp:Transcript_33836/g.95787  ORF Transcript_33836/g.95787 Transcript_33836/m.95787 type:complete len:460 (-) Transcript_33836:1345-2724(-)
MPPVGDSAQGLPATVAASDTAASLRHFQQGGKGVTETLGEQVTGIVAPVSICMALTVVLVRILNPDGESSSASVAIATAYYNEEEGDSTSEKIAGSIINALIFVAIIAAMTFVLFLLFKYRCYKIIYGYMGFAGFNIFFFLSGTLALKVLQTFYVPVDAITFCYVLYNFAVVGVLSLFFMPVPITMKQGYLVITGVVVAYIFTLIPEWTTWVMLIAMALYDLCAVLIPGGPLKVLVELAVERDEEIPALVYESRPVQAGQAPGQWSQRHRRNGQQAVAVEREGDTPTIRPPGPIAEAREPGSNVGTLPQPEPSEPDATEESRSPLIADQGREDNFRPDHPEQRRGEGGGRPPRQDAELGQLDDDDDEFGIPDTIKLGLGDFIFYSVLVGRASMYDLLTVFASYLAIIAGLGMTLLCLAVFQKALPALPFSIALGVVFYFLARAVLEPFVVPMVTNLVFF